MDILIIQKFLIAIGIGALIGVEREREKQAKFHIGSGFRTYVLISLLGAITSYLGNILGLEFYFAFIFLGFSAMVVFSYYFFAKKGNLGVITELSSIITFLLGFIALTEFTFLSVMLVAVMVILIESDKIVKAFIQNTSKEEWFDTLKFAAVALIVYPVLPNEFIDPWNAFNPSKIWLLVVLISGIELIGYFLLKATKSKRSILVSGLIGGLVSSTATTLSMAGQSKKNVSLSKTYSLAAVFASLVMYVRVLVVIGVLSPELLGISLLYISPQILVLIILILIVGWKIFFGKEKVDNKKIEIVSGSPFRFVPALKMAGIFSLVLIVVKIVDVYFGNAGIYFTSTLSGLADVDAITISISSLFNTANIDSTFAVQGIILAIISNTFVKASMAKINGTSEFGNKVFLMLGGSFLTGLVVFFLV